MARYWLIAFRVSRWFYLTLGLSSKLVFSQGFLGIPIGGTYMEDYMINFYVDWGVDSLVYDHQCDSKTYDGHAGTDFILKHFRAMDDGIPVLAAADGIVHKVVADYFDREKTIDPSKGFGNYIGITHEDKWYTYYAHLRIDGIRVREGDIVRMGDTLGWVGSSGNSSDPHLHFEVWYDSIYYVDPFNGICGNPQSLWIQTPEFISDFGIWYYDFCNFIPTLDDLRESPPSHTTFSLEDEAVTFYALLYGLRSGDELVLEWISPEGDLWFQFDHVLDRDWWYYYYWTYIFVPTSLEGLPGIWHARLKKNNEMVIEVPFEVQSSNQTTTLEPEESKKLTWHYVDGQGWWINNVPPESNGYLMQTTGTLLQVIKSNDNPMFIPDYQYAKGLYVLKVENKLNENQWVKLIK